METGKYSAPAPRYLTLAVGLVATLIGAGLLALGGFGGYRMLYETPGTSVTIILCISLVIGLAMLSWGLRLVSGRHRRDGGLLSPWVLRSGGVILLIGPIAILASHRSLVSLVEAGTMLSAGVAAFAIARRRSRQEG
jgi:hypothetical protein